MGVIPIARSLYRKRLGLAPAYITTGVVALGEASQYAPLTPVALSTAGVGLACASWITRHGGDSRHKTYLYAVLSASASVVLTLHEIGWSHFDWTTMLAAGLGSVMGIPWWHNNRRQTRVTVEATVNRWPALAAKLNIRTVRMVGVHAHGGGNIEGRFIWPAGDHTVSDMIDKRERIEGALDLPSGSLRMERDGRDSNSVLFKAFRTDPHKDAITWQIPTEHIDGEYYIKEINAMDPITLGFREDGQVKHMTLTDLDFGSRSVMIAGAKGSGKSGLLNLLVANRACAVNAVLWGIDLKGGMELGPWRPVMDWVVKTFDDALMLLEALEAVVDARANYCEKNKLRKWPMDENHPVLTVVVDECHSFNGAMKRSQLEMLERVVQKGRAVGVEVIEATQYPTLVSLGSNLVRQQLDQRFCFRMQDGTGEYFVFGGKVSVDAHMIAQNRPGTCYYQDAEEIDRMPLRVQYVDDATVENVVRLRQGRTCPLDDVSGHAALAAVPEYGDRPGHVPVDDVPDSRNTAGHVPDEAGTGRDMPSWLDGPDVPLADLERLRMSRLSEQERDDEQRARDTMSRPDVPKLDEEAAMSALRDALVTAGPGGMSARDLARAATRSSSWLYPKLTELKEKDQVERTKRGTWAWCGRLTECHSS